MVAFSVHRDSLHIKELVILGQCVYSALCPGVSISPSIVCLRLRKYSDTVSSFHGAVSVVSGVCICACCLSLNYSMSKPDCADADKGSCVSVCRGKQMTVLCARPVCVCVCVGNVCTLALRGSSCRRS